MRLTRFSDIGLRVLIYLAKDEQRGSCVTVSEVASQFDIPLNHLVKVVGQLARSGWVQATRGRNGGIRLSIDASQLKIGTVLRELEGDSELVDCDSQPCMLQHDCILRGALRAGMNAFYATMDRYSLEDICAGNTGIKVIQMHRQFINRQTEQAAQLPA